MKKIAFAGYYGMNNYGDDLFAVVAAYGAKEYWGTNKIEVVSPPIKELDVKYSLNKLHNIYSGDGILSKILRSFVMIRTYFRNDMVILAGGTNINSQNYNSMRKLQIKLNSLGVADIAAIGISIGPFNTQEEINKIEQILNQFSYISVRDVASLNWLNKMNIKSKYILGRDLAGLMPLISPQKKEEQSKKVLGISLCNFESYKDGDVELESKRNKAIIESLKRLSLENKDKIKFKVFVLNTHKNLGDQELSNQLLSELKSTFADVEIIYSNSNPIYIWKEINKCTSFFSIRLHGAITAYLADIPFALVEYHEKCTDFIKDINQPKKLWIKNDETNQEYFYKILNDIVFNRKSEYLKSPKDYTEETIKTFTEAPWYTD